MEQKIGKYKVLREIGKGGMGIVYKGFDTATQKNVAIKVLPATMVDHSTVERFHREVQAMSKLRHPNLVELYDYGMTKGQHYFAMEFIDGESLKTFMKHKGLLSVKEAIAIIYQVLQALECIHKEGMIHRDIKPSNIMITQNGCAKLMDFGLVHIPGLTRVTVEGTALGTAEYMSPEQISGEGVDTRSDIYSFGIMMYEMLRGNPPFTGKNFQSILMKHKHDVPPPVNEFRRQISPELAQIVSKAMQKDISQRYQRVGELIDDISKLEGVMPNEVSKTATLREAVTEVIPGRKEMLKRERGKGKDASKAKIAPKGSLVFTLLILAAVAGYMYREQIPSFVKDLPAKLAAIKNRKGFFIKSGAQRKFETLQKADKHHRAGRQFYSKKSFDKAIAEYKKAIKLREGYAPYYKDLAVAYDKKGDTAKAIKAWEEVLQCGGEDGTYANMAHAEIAELKAE